MAGLTAAYLLQRTHDVTLFETDDRLGGHAHTHDIGTPDDRVLPIDSGFIVHNERTYPNLLRLFSELGVATQPTEMSMSITCAGCGLEYAGARGLPGLFAQLRRAGDPAYLRMLTEVKRFHAHARRLLDHADAEDTGTDVDGLTLGTFLALGGYSRYFVQHFMIPVVSCVWSTGTRASLEYPALYLFRFLDNHGMLSVTGSPQWRTVTGGSRTYVEQAAKGLSGVQTGTGIRAVTRHPDGVELIDDDGQRHAADAVVVATHPDQALRLLGDPTDDERAVLGAFAYSRNETAAAHRLPHAAHLPAGPGLVELPDGRLRRPLRGRAGQLLDEPAAGPRRAGRLPGHPQRHRPDRARLGAAPDGLRAPRLHAGLGGRPAAAARADHRPDRLRRRLPRLGFPRGRLRVGCAGGRGVRGGLVTGLQLRRPDPAATVPDRTPVATPALYDVRIAHTRSAPLRNSFEYGGYLWLVDLDDVAAGRLVQGRPLPRWLRSQARFESADHLGDPAASIKDNVVALARQHGIDDVDRVLMLASARSGLGRASYVFNPLSTHWCYRADGSPACLVAEVHNTYGERHGYLLRLDDAGRAEADKEFYVSPFLEVDGRYLMRFSPPGRPAAHHHGAPAGRGHPVHRPGPGHRPPRHRGVACSAPPCDTP